MNWMKVKTAGLPRWAWVALFSGAVITGLYLRHRAAENEEETEEEPTYGEDSLSAYEGSEQAGGLAGAGLIGPAQGQVVPVEAPYIPEAVPNVIESQDNTIGILAGAIAEREPGERVEKEIIREPVKVTGGGAPKTKPHHKPPKKDKPPKNNPGGNKGGGGGKKKGGKR